MEKRKNRQKKIHKRKKLIKGVSKEEKVKERRRGSWIEMFEEESGYMEIYKQEKKQEDGKLIIYWDRGMKIASYESGKNGRNGSKRWGERTGG